MVIIMQSFRVCDGLMAMLNMIVIECGCSPYVAIGVIKNTMCPCVALIVLINMIKSERHSRQNIDRILVNGRRIENLNSAKSWRITILARPL